MWEVISSTIWDVFLSWIYKAFFDAISDFFTMMGNLGVGMFDLSWVQAVIKLFSMFGWALFVVGLVVCIFDVAIEQHTGRANIRTTAMNVIKGFFAVSLFSVLPVELYKFCVNLQNILSHDLSSISDISVDYEKISALVVLCNQLELSPIHLRDVVEDFLAEQ